MRIQTIHPAVSVGAAVVQFKLVEPGTYEAEVDDAIGQQLLDAAVNGDYRRLDVPPVSPVPDAPAVPVVPDAPAAPEVTPVPPAPEAPESGYRRGRKG